jgi:hypothetical protein
VLFKRVVRLLKVPVLQKEGRPPPLTPPGKYPRLSLFLVTRKVAESALLTEDIAPKTLEDCGTDVEDIGVITAVS